MNRKIKKILAVALLIIMLFGISPAAGISGVFSQKAQALTWIKSGLFEYSLDSQNKATIKKISTNQKLTGNVVIPSEIDGYTVVAIYESGFINTEMTSVSIPATVTSIGASAFSSNKNLTTVYYNAVNASAGSTNKYFVNCPLLTNFIIGNGVKSFPTLFNYDTETNQAPIKKLTFPDSVESIAEKAFCGMKKLETVEIGKGLRSVGEYAFKGCNELKKITVDILNPYCFSDECGVLYCNNSLVKFPPKNNVTNYVMPKDITKIEKYAVEGAASLTDFYVSDEVTLIDEYAFYNCSNLQNVRMGEELLYIKRYAMYGCSSIKNIYLFKNLSTVEGGGLYSSYGSHYASDIYYEGSQAEYKNIAGYNASSGLTDYGTTVHYNWKPTYIVEYDANTGTNAPARQTKTKDVALTLTGDKPTKEYKVTLISTETSYRNTITVSVPFSSWNTRADGLGDTYYPNGRYTENQSAVLYAQWGDAVIGSFPSLSLSGYVLSGWYTSSSGGTLITTSTPITGDIVLYARWTERTGNPALYGLTIDSALNLSKGSEEYINYYLNKDAGAVVTLTWSSSNSNVASVDQNGKVTSRRAGSATITCVASDTNGNSYTARCSVTVTDNTPILRGITIDSSMSLNKGSEKYINYSINKDTGAVVTLTWSSSNSSVASVDQNGKVTGKLAGKATITCVASDTSGNSYTARCSVTVTDNTPILRGITIDSSLNVTINNEAYIYCYINADTGAVVTLTWSSSNSNIVSVDQNGKVTGKLTGKATITCVASDTNGNSFTAKCVVSVLDGRVYSVSVSDISLNYKKSATLSPVIAADKGVRYTVRYESSNPKVATVDQNGKVTATKRGSGSATITCTVTDQYGNVVKDTCTVKVSLTFGQKIIVYVLFGWIWY